MHSETKAMCALTQQISPTFPALVGSSGVLRKLGDFSLADSSVACARFSTIHGTSWCRAAALELRIHAHELSTCGNITFRMGHTHWLCTSPSGGARLAKDGKGMTWIPRIVEHHTKSRSETPGTCTDRRSSNARPSGQPSRARPNRGAAVTIQFQWD